MQLGSVQSTAKWEWNRLPTGSWFFQWRLNNIVSSILPSCIKLDQIQIHHCVSFIHEAVAQRLRICARTAGKPVNFFQTIFSHWLVRSICLLVLCPPVPGEGGFTIHMTWIQLALIYVQSTFRQALLGSMWNASTSSLLVLFFGMQQIISSVI